VLVESSGFSIRRASAWLRTFKNLEVVMELMLHWHVLGGAPRVRSRCCGHFVTDRLEVPW